MGGKQIRITLPSNWVSLGVASGGVWRGGEARHAGGVSTRASVLVKDGVWHLEKARPEGRKRDQQ